MLSARITSTCLYIYEYCDVKILKQLNAIYQEKIQHDAFVQLNIDNADANDYFNVIFDGNAIEAMPHNKAEGLFVADDFILNTLSGFEDFNSPKNKIKVALEAKIRSEPKLESLLSGFVINLQESDNYFSTEIHWISGKGNKVGDAIVSHINIIDSLDEYQGLVTPELAEIVSLKNKAYENSNDICIDEIVTQVALFDYTSRLFQLLKNEILYFSLNDNSYSMRKSDLIKTSILTDKARLIFSLTEEDDFYKLGATIRINEVLEVSLDEVIFNHAYIGIYKNNLIHLACYNDFLALEQFISDPIIRCLKKDFVSFYDTVVAPIQKDYLMTLKNIKSKKINLKPVSKRIYVSEFEQFIVFRPKTIYTEDITNSFLESSSHIRKTESGFVEYFVDQGFENEFEEQVRKLHPSFKMGGRQGFFNISIDEMLKNYWFINAFEQLKQDGIEVWGLNTLKNFKYSVHQPKISIQFKSRQDWFDTEVEIVFGDSKVRIQELKKALKENRNYILLDDGTHGIVPQEWMLKFEQLFRSGKEDGEQVKISKLNFNLLEQFADDRISEDIVKELAEKKAKLRDFKGIKDIDIPASITANLRDYQKEGFNWLNFLDEFSWGGILADDMGLGKTLQIITFLQHQKELNKGQSLVVVPTSLLFNWQDELKKFAPALNFHLHYGNDRKLDFKEKASFDLLLTSYGTLCNDIEYFKKIRFNYIILDESQAIKNITSLRYKAVCSLKANNRIAMTGTPVENSTLELFAQMNFANPGFLLTTSHFKDNYVKAIEQDQNKERLNELRNRVNPFILRRTKSEVLKELPDKTEEVLYCIMSDEQRKVYDAYRNQYRNMLLGVIDQEGVSKNVFKVLEGLTKLRQICDSPQLLESENLAAKASIKIDELKRHIQDKTGNHKILIFSQFVKMLKLIEGELQKTGIVYEYLDGQTDQKKRELKVKKFQSDEGCRVFLISLKAGGVGLNLTEADYVYIVDPWWNPAVENQAIDRCYRMGQKKNVTAFRMICKDTIEEKIFELQKQKKALSENLLDSGEGIVKNLSREDIEKLFS
jgi:SNF2 family DNA or RNA helicase